jgi:predicted MFS family arabinose efflux permease
MNPLISLYKNAFGGLSKEVWLLSLIMFINRSGTMVIAFLSLYLTQSAKMSVNRAGIVMMIFGMGALVGSWLGGWLTDKKGPFFVQIWSLAIGGLLFFFVKDDLPFYAICTWAFLLSIFGEAYRPANQVAIAHFSTPETFTRSVSLVRLAINLGWSIGPAIGGVLAFYNFKYLFWLDGFTNIFAALLVYYTLKETKKNTGKLISKAKKTKDSPWRDTPFLWFIAFTTLYALCFFPLFTIMGLYYHDILGFTTPQIGFIMASNGLAVAVIEMILLYKIQLKYNPLKLIVLGVLCLVANYLFIIGSTHYVMILVAMLLASFSEMLAMPFMNTITINSAKMHNRGQYSALYAMAWAFSQGVSPLLGTQIISHFGYSSLLYVFLGISSLSAVGFTILKKTFDTPA